MSARASVFAILRQLLLPALGICLFVGVGLLHVTSRVLVVRKGYALSRAQGENRLLARENDRLRLELATLKNPMRLEKVAKAELGMAPPPAGAVVTLVSTPRLGRAPKREARPAQAPERVARAARGGR